MRDADMQRLQSDMETMRSVLGADLPFERVDVQGSLAAGITALLPAVVCLAGGRAPLVLLSSAMPLLIVMAVYVLRNYWRSRPSQPCPAAKRREYRIGLPIMLGMLPLALALPKWAAAAGAPAQVGQACVLLFIGLMLLYTGLYDAGRRSSLFVAVPTICVALAWPFIGYFTLWTSIFLAAGWGLIAAGLYMRWQLGALASTRA